MYFSRATPNLAKVIPAMDQIDGHLASAATKHSFKPCIRGALAVGRRLLNKYYSYTDHSELYRIAISELFLLAVSMLYNSLINAH